MLLERETDEGYEFIGSDIYPAFFYAIVISYARPFTNNNQIGALPSRWSKFSEPEKRKTHKLLIETRHTVVAHSDPIGHKVKIIPPGYESFPVTGPSEDIAMHIEKSYFNRQYFKSIYTLCRHQLVEMNDAIDTLLEKLYAGMDLPPVPFRLKIDEGL